MPKLVILLTDGSQTQDTINANPANVAAEMRNAGINIFAVAIGKSTNATELVSITGSEEKVFNKTTFPALLESDFIKEIKEESCKTGECLLIARQIFMFAVFFIFYFLPLHQKYGLIIHHYTI